MKPVRLDKTLNYMFALLAVLIILITLGYVERIVLNNNVNSLYNCEMSLTGARLSDEFYTKVKETATYKTANGVAKQFEFEVFNTGEGDLTHWNISMVVPTGSRIEDAWNVELSNNGRTISLTPVYYNIVLKQGSSLKFGFILESKVDYTPLSLSISGYILSHMGTTIASRALIILLMLWGIAFVGYIVTLLNSRNYRIRQETDVKIILQSMNTFISFIDAKDPYTRGHSRRVAMYAAEIAKRMHLSEDEIQNIYYAGLLHDAGKISVPDAVLNKPGKLSDEERKTIQNHTVAGGKMLAQMSSLRGVRETALYHHERYDGRGYPEGLSGEMIPLYARIVGVADSYDAMSSNRVYRRHLNKDEIIEEMQIGMGTQFDPNILKYMVDMINDGYVNVVKMETADNEDGTSRFHITESDIPGVYMGF